MIFMDFQAPQSARMFSILGTRSAHPSLHNYSPRKAAALPPIPISKNVPPFLPAAILALLPFLKINLFFHLKIRLRALSARRFFKRDYRFIFFLFLIACSLQNSLRSTYLWKEATASKFPRFHPTQKSSKSATSKQQAAASKQNPTSPPISALFRRNAH